MVGRRILRHPAMFIIPLAASPLDISGSLIFLRHVCRRHSKVQGQGGRIWKRASSGLWSVLSCDGRTNISLASRKHYTSHNPCVPAHDIHVLVLFMSQNIHQKSISGKEPTPWQLTSTPPIAPSTNRPPYTHLYTRYVFTACLSCFVLKLNVCM